MHTIDDWGPQAPDWDKLHTNPLTTPGGHSGTAFVLYSMSQVASLSLGFVLYFASLQFFFVICRFKLDFFSNAVIISPT